MKHKEYAEKPIRVLQVLDKIDVSSGVNSVVMNYYSCMDHSIVQFDFIVFGNVDDVFRKNLDNEGARVFNITSPLSSIKGFYNDISSFFVKHSEYKIIHCHTPNAAFFFLSIAKSKKIPIRIVHSHNAQGADSHWKRIRNRVLFLTIPFVSNGYVACSDKAAAFLFGQTKRNVFILPNAVDYKKYQFQPEERKKTRNEMGISKDTLLIGHIGRFALQKNHGFMLQIFRSIIHKKKNTKLLLIGDGPLREEILYSAKKAGIREKIISPGIVSDPEKYLQAMDIFILPSFYEGLPVVGVEAQRVGLPCIFSEYITRQVAFKDSSICRFLAIDNADEWADAILGLSIEHSRKSQYDPMFDLHLQSVKLQNYYIEKYKEGERV